MEKSQKELESLVQSQKQQLTRYETRLKDVVTAYKSLLKEKEALEASLAALTTKTPDQNASGTEGASKTPSMASTADTNQANNMDQQLQLQISTLMNSLATLSAEKSKMEASFQADKRTLRSELKTKDKLLAEIQEKLNNAAAQTKLDVEKVKSKLIIERHDWEKESGNQLAMVKELQKLLADERQIKDNLQMQLNDLKVHVSKTGNEANHQTVSELTTELEHLKRKLKENERELMKSSGKMELPSADVLKKLQSEMMHLKRQHTAAIQSEQNRAYLAEERNKALAAMHEERVASLESRLAELSASVGLYDRLRQTDQELIAKFKEKVAQLSNGSVDELANDQMRTIESVNQRNYNNWNVNELINEILLLHNVLLLENSKLAQPVDTSRLYNAFNTIAGLAIDTSCNCAKKYDSLVNENAQIRAEFEQAKEQIETHKSHIKTLQSKVEVLNRNIDEQEMELRNKAQEHNTALRAERCRWKEIVSNMEIEFRTKQSDLEIQLQKQRERSLALLEEKENEIASLKASFDIFMMPKPMMMRKPSETSSNGDSINVSNNEMKDSLTNLNNIFHGSSDDVNQTALTLGRNVKNGSSKEPMHMLHYVHELSRKEVEITALRKGKHMAEQTLRQALQDKAATQESLYDKIATLEEQVDRLERCKTREGANLEYLKNVFLSFLLSNDMEGRRHKVNAIAAVLQFNPSETATVNKYFQIKDSKK